MQTILIIDDDAAIGDLEQEVLERAGYAVHARPGSPAGRPRGTRSPPAGRWATPPDTAGGRCPYRRAAFPPARCCGAGWSAPPQRASCTRGGTRSAAAAGPASPVTAPRWSAPGGFQCGGPARHAASPSAGSAAAVRTSVLHIKKEGSIRSDGAFLFLLGLPLLSQMQQSPGLKLQKETPSFRMVFLFGAGDEARTRYLDLGKVALYQMSYARKRRRCCGTLVPPVGVEPTTRGFSVRCSTN